MQPHEVVVLQGDQTGQELLDQALCVMDPAVTGVPTAFRTFDLSLENRRRTQNQVVYEAAAAMRETGLAIKAATITPEEPGDVGSPNAILRREIDGSVIIRTGRRIPGVAPIGGLYAPISVVRMAVGDAYDAREWREQTPDGDELAFRTESISRRVCRAVSEIAFQLARKNRATVFGGPKYTVSPVYEGMLKEEMDAAAARYADVRYNPQLIDATYALLLTTSGEPLIIPTLNRDGDCMSDLVLQMFGSIAGAESLLLAVDDRYEPRVVMAEAPHGTAPSLYGKNVANPMAMILAAASLLRFFGTAAASAAARAIAEATLEAVYDGLRTADLRGTASTTDFTNEVIRRTRTKLAVWSTLE